MKDDLPALADLDVDGASAKACSRDRQPRRLSPVAAVGGATLVGRAAFMGFDRGPSITSAG
jgi:hypothetical protein